ncbi:MAG: DUF4404 family protein [Gammaproteobacteria bacterium]|nr:DUF4404 family protein [Gammaproteobacteria bacterium]
MSEPEINTLLSQLHSKLNDSPNIDDETHRMLGIVSQDIAILLGRNNDSSEDKDKSIPGSITLKKMAVEFEAEHPRLAHTLNDIADSLAKIGI